MKEKKVIHIHRQEFEVTRSFGGPYERSLRYGPGEGFDIKPESLDIKLFVRSIKNFTLCLIKTLCDTISF